MRRRSGITLGEVLMSLSLLAVVLVSSLLILQWALRGSQRQQTRTTAAFLAQGQMEKVLAAEQVGPDAGVFPPPYSNFRWISRVDESPGNSFIGVTLTVQSAGGTAYSLYTQRCKVRRSLIYRTDNALFRSHEDLPAPERLIDNLFTSDFALSPDGSQLALVSFEEGKPQIFARTLDASTPTRRLFFRAEGACEPRYSPDGRWLAFCTQEGGESLVMAYDLRNQQVVRHGRGGAPSWMPDSQSLVACRDGERLVLLKDGAESVLVDGSRGWNAMPDVAPDGRSVVFLSNRDGNPELYLFEMSSRRVKRLTEDPAFDSQPKFSEDGRRILFARKPEGAACRLYSMNVDGSGLTALTVEGQSVENGGWWP